MVASRLRSVAEIARSSSITEGQLRWWIFHADTLGFSRVVIRRGRRVFIDEVELDAWLEAGRGKAAA